MQVTQLGWWVGAGAVVRRCDVGISMNSSEDGYDRTVDQQKDTVCNARIVILHAGRRSFAHLCWLLPVDAQHERCDKYALHSLCRRAYPRLLSLPNVTARVAGGWRRVTDNLARHLHAGASRYTTCHQDGALLIS